VLRPHRHRRDSRHGPELAGLVVAQAATGPRTREDERRSGRVVKRHGGRLAHPDARNGELMGRALRRDQGEFPYRHRVFRVPDHGYHAMPAYDRGDLRVKGLRGPFDRHQPGRGFGSG
jgi:hypothetical protein